MKTVLKSVLALIGLGVSVAALGSITNETPEQAAAKQAAHAEYDAKWAAIEACRSVVVSKSAFPSKADFYAEVYAVSDDGIHWSVVGKVDMMNAFGAMLPFQYGCVVDGTTVTRNGLRPA